MYGGEKFATLIELLKYYKENATELRQKNGGLIELTQPLNSKEEVTTKRWFHTGITGQQAEKLLQSKGEHGSFLVRASAHSPGDYTLTARIDANIAHFIIRCERSDCIFFISRLT